MNQEQMRALGYQVIDYIVDYRSQREDQRIYNVSRYEELDQLIPAGFPDKGEDPAEVFAFLQGLLQDHVVHTDHPRFFSFIPGPSNYISTLANTLSTGYNVFAGHWMAGSAAAMVEMRLLRWLGDLFGYPKESGGVFVSGGSMANLTAIATARTVMLGEYFSDACIYYSEQTHSSMAKGLRILGFRRDQMRSIAVKEDFTLDIATLRAQLQADEAAGLKPFCVVGNAGTTNTGAVDDLTQIAELCAQKDLWFHIDGAYGAAAVLAEPYRDELKGIDLADSITLDPHKWWFQPFETGCLLVKNRLHLKKAFQVQAEYLDDTVNLRENEEINFYDHGVQLTRSFRALKLYAYFRIQGIEQLRKDITQGITHAGYIETLLRKEPHWEIISPAQLGIVAFRLKIFEVEIQNDAINKALSDHLSQSGFAMITTTRLRDRVCLRMCPIHPETTTSDLERTVGMMNEFVFENQ